MKKWKAVCLLALGMGPLLAQGQGISLKTETGGDFGIQVFEYTFDADRDGAFDMALASKKIGVVGSFTRAYPDGWFWGGDARYATGATSFSSAAQGSNSGNSENLLELRLTAGRDIQAGSQILSPYAGLGYRSVYSNLKDYTSTGYVSPTRTANQVYIPFGLTHRFAVNNKARVATTVEADYLLTGTQQTRYTDIVGFVSDLSVTQKRGFGGRLAVAYETAQWSAGIFYHYWNIQESEIGTYADSTTVFSATEAHNITRELGMQLRYRYY